MSNLNDILKTAIDNKASDIHILVGQPPQMRLHTQMTTTDFPMVTAESSLRMLKEMLNEKRMEAFMEKPVIIEAAINGVTSKQQNSNVPRMPDEIAKDALQCFVVTH